VAAERAHRERRARIDPQVADVLWRFEAVSLEALDDRASLMRRVDHKYAITPEAFVKLAERLAGDHQVLEIDGSRAFSYISTYFDTPDLRCFVDHVEDRMPRFKARSRLYADSGKCVFEVKLKRDGGETDKRQIDYSPDDRRRLTDDAVQCLRDSLETQQLEPPEDLGATLTTSFDRVTLGARDGSERLTCDFGVCLVGRDGDSVQMHEDRILIETKSEDGESPADRALEQISATTISLSKYRVGMSLVGGAERFGSQPGSDLFS
jgi:hypothetical protein